MNLPPRVPQKRDPEDVIRELEEDPLTQIVWSLPYSLSKLFHRLVGTAKRKPVAPARKQSIACTDNRI